MSTGYYPSPIAAYDSLPYRFDLFETVPPVSFPVAGPGGFNRLTVCRTRVFLIDYAWSDDELHRRSVEVRLPVQLSDADQRGTGIQHSSTGTIRMMQISDEDDLPTDDGNTSFVWSLDAVHPGYRLDDDGWVWLTVDVADQSWQVYAGVYVELSSWVLHLEVG